MKDRIDELQEKLDGIVQRRADLQLEVSQLTQEALRLDGALSELKRLDKEHGNKEEAAK